MPANATQRLYPTTAVQQGDDATYVGGSGIVTVCTDGSANTGWYSGNNVTLESNSTHLGKLGTFAAVPVPDLITGIQLGCNVSTYNTGSGTATDDNLNPKVGLYLGGVQVCKLELTQTHNASGTYYYAPYVAERPGGGPFTATDLTNLQIWVAGYATGRYRSLIAETFIYVRYARKPGTSRTMRPVDGATVQTNTPAVSLAISDPDSHQNVHAMWQFATNSAFSANLKSFEQVAHQNIKVPDGSTTQVNDTLPTSLKLFTGAWFLRGRTVDEYGLAGPYFGPTALTVSHPSSAGNPIPTGATYVSYTGSVNIQWEFSDTSPDDSQSAYQLVVERSSDGLVILDTGKVTSTAQSKVVTLAATYKSQLLRWKVQTWDQDNTTDGYIPYNTFYTADIPSLSFVSPTNNQVLTTGRPTVTWSSADNSGKGLASWRVRMVRTSDSHVMDDSGVTAGTATSYTPAANVLANATAYVITITVTDKAGLSKTVSIAVTTSYQQPANVSFTLDSDDYSDLGYALLDWSATSPDVNFISWNVYRQDVNSPDGWILLATITNSDITTYKDWFATSGSSYQYGVTQTADRSGQPIDSNVVASATVQLINSQYWLLSQQDPTQNVLIPNVTGDNYTDATDQVSYVVEGRGTRTDYGTHAGIAGTLTCQLRDSLASTARQKRQALMAMRLTRQTFLLKNPFGDIFTVSIGDMTIDRIAGVSTNEFVDVTIPYQEVF